MPRYAESRVLPYPCARLFDLAADVERYPEFVPWWAAARIRKRQGNLYHTDQIIRYGALSLRFPSRTVMERPRRITVAATGGAFRALTFRWTFTPADGGCRVGLEVRVEPRSALLGRVVGLVSAGAARRLADAFEARAHALYGEGAPKT